MSKKMKPALEILLERERERMQQRQEMEDMMQHSDLLRSISNVHPTTLPDPRSSGANHHQPPQGSLLPPPTKKRRVDTLQQYPSSAIAAPASSPSTSGSVTSTPGHTPTSTHDGPSPAATSTPPMPRKACNCKKSNCLKLYCECFQQGSMCGSDCNCQGCHNSLDFENQRQRAIRVVLERNPVAFLPKVSTGANSVATTKYFRGCRCRRSGCLKKYCECFQAGVKCGTLCRCQMCKNCNPDTTSDHHHPPQVPRQHDHPPPPHAPDQRDILRPPPHHAMHAADAPAASLSSSRRVVSTMPPSFPPSSTYTTKASKPHVLSHAKRKLVDPSKYMELPAVAGGRPASSRLLKPQVSSRLYPLETSLATDASVQKICLALVHAACVDDKLLLPSSSTPRPPVNGGGAASRVPMAPFTSPLKTAISPPSFHSPSVDALLCSEDMECTPQKGSGSMTGGEVDQDRRSELQEKAVLQEFSVWLRNLATASVNHVMQHSTPSST